MKKKFPKSSSNNTATFTRKLFPANKRSRVAALFILALAVTAASVATIAFAQSRKRARSGGTGAPAEKVLHAQRSMIPGRNGPEREGVGGVKRDDRDNQEGQNVAGPMQYVPSEGRKPVSLKPTEHKISRASHSFDGDLRDLPFVKEPEKERPEREAPRPNPGVLTTNGQAAAPAEAAPAPEAPSVQAPAPAPSITFDGLDFATWGAGHPPDTNGDVGPNHYIQTVNTSIGIYNKATGARIAAFTFNTFMSQGAFGNLCDTDNFGDPVVMYDTFEDRWVITDFAFKLDASNNVINPPGSFQCFAVSKTGDPVSGGWNFYSINTAGGLGDYPKFGIWPDGIYMSTNMFDYAASGSFQNSRVYAFNKAQMYAGAPTVQSVSFDLPSDQFTVLPANARLQTGTPPAGSPNYMASVWNFLNSAQIWKFKVDWNLPATSAVTGPFDSTMPTWWVQYGSACTGTAPSSTATEDVPSPGTRLDTLTPRLMMQNQYSNIGGVESLWDSHTVGGGATPNPTAAACATQSAVRYYQINVTGGTVAANAAQNFTYNPDTTLHRFMASSAVDRLGDMAIGYSTSNATNNPALKYAGRLAGDAANSITQTEQTLFQGAGTQNTTSFTRWGDYSAMSLDPDGCTFWYTNEYYAVNGTNDLTRIGAFKLNAQCSVVGSGTVSGTVTASPGGTPIAGATVALGSRTTATDAGGNYSFTGLPEGTYPTMSASFPGLTTATAATIVVTNGGTTTKNFSLSAASQSGCQTDTSQTDFNAGVNNNTELTTSPGDVKLLNAPAVDQQNTDTAGSGFGFSSTAWFGQTFTPAVTGQATTVAVELFCSSCTGTPPNVVLAIRNATSNLPSGSDLASVSVPFSNSGSGGFVSGTFASPPTLTAGTQYAIVIRMSAAYSTGTPAYTVSSSNTYAGGRRATSSTSGSSWTGVNATDLDFKVTMKTGFKTSGDYTSGVKDSNPATGATPNWTTLSWTNAALPAGTGLKFQAAASNNSAGPFSFVGPDGTASTFYTTSGGSLAQFNGKRYLKYKAFLTTTNTANTPTLNDVTVCYNDASLVTTTLTADSATGTFGGTVNLSATLTDGTNGINGKSVSFKLNGNSVGSANTNASGVATLSNVSLAGINAGSYPTGVSASFAGDSGDTSSSSTAALTVNKASQTITFNALADKTYGDANFNVSASASSGLSVGLAASGNCTSSGSTVHITGAGSCTITASQAGNSNYDAATDVPQSFNIAKANTTTTVTAANANYDGNPHGGTASVTGPASLSQSLTVSYAGRNGTTYGPSNTAPTNVGDYTASASYAGDSNYNTSSDSKDFSISKASQSITFNTLADKTYGDGDFNVSATATSGLSVSFAASGNCTSSGSTVHITGAGSCTVTASQAGDGNYNAATDVARPFNIAKANQTITFNALSDKTYGDADFAVSASASSGLSVGFAASGNCSVSDGTVHITGAGSCTVTASQGGDSNYNAASDVARSFDIAKANQAITFGALADKTYGDADFGVSASASSGLGVSFGASGDCSVSGNTVHINGAGSCIITASQAGDTNYNAAADVPQSFQIAKASATITLGSLSQTYDGTPKSATATTNPAGLSVTITYTPASQASHRATNTTAAVPVNAGSYTVTATINDPNYQGTASDTLVISKADAVVSVTGYTGTYDGNSHTASGTATGAQSEDLSSLLDFGASYKNVPGGTAHWTFNSGNANTNYNSSGGDVQITISKATPVINWSNPADIIYGTALGGTQLNATANTPGAFTYTPAAGTVLSSGNSQNLHAAFTPTDTTNYNGASKDVFINVLSAVLSVSMTADRNPAPVGLNFNYKATISNTGNAPSTNTVLTDVLPSLVTFTAATASQGTCSYNSTTRAVTCNVGTVAPGSTVNVQISVKPRDEGTLDDTAAITGGQWDPATGNSSASVNGLQAIKLVDLSVSLTDSADPIFVGDQTTYTMVLKNSNTTINATGVSLQNALPSGMTFVAAATTQGSLVTPPVGSTGIVTANIGTVAPNATVTVTVTAKGASAGVQTSTASVSSNETDSNTSNNTATQTTTVKAVVVVGLQKVLLAKQVMTGGCESTTGNVYLTAPAPAGGVTVTLSSNISGVTVPALVDIPQGAMVSPAFNVTTSQVTAKQSGLVTATSGANSVSRSVTINIGGGACPP